MHESDLSVFNNIQSSQYNNGVINRWIMTHFWIIHKFSIEFLFACEGWVLFFVFLGGNYRFFFLFFIQEVSMGDFDWNSIKNSIYPIYIWTHVASTNLTYFKLWPIIKFNSPLEIGFILFKMASRGLSAKICTFYNQFNIFSI